ncbi:MAG: hypothetical protein IJS49_07190 [Paludibacteraceae bacterium]|nr:hypothetical protein [Paludibacteraceae bacterium]
MKKLYSLLLLGGLLFFGVNNAWAGQITFYVASSTAYTVKANINCVDNSDWYWSTGEMSLVEGKTYNSKNVYSYTFYATQVSTTQIQLYDGSTHKGEKVATSGSTFSVENIAGRIYDYEEGKWCWAVRGSWNGWASSYFAYDGETLSINCSANATPSFKIGEEGTTCNVWKGAPKGQNASLYSNNCTNWALDANDGNQNCVLHTTVAGAYSFSWNTSTARLDVTYPTTYSRSGLSAGGWGTLCLPVKINSVTGATLYQIHSYNSDGSGVILFTPADYYAGNAYIFKLDAGVDEISVGLDNANYDGDANNYQGLYGTYSPITINGSGSETNLYVVSGGQLIQAAQNCSVGEFRAYVNKSTIPSFVPSAPGVRYLEIPMAPENATDINAIEANEKAIKFIEDGQIFIQKNGIVYDMTGRVVR